MHPELDVAVGVARLERWDRSFLEPSMHLVGVHKNSAAITNGFATNDDCHLWEHGGPGGIRNHDRGNLGFDEAEVEAVLEEAEEHEGGAAQCRSC